MIIVLPNNLRLKNKTARLTALFYLSHQTKPTSVRQIRRPLCKLLRLLFKPKTRCGDRDEVGKLMRPLSDTRLSIDSQIPGFLLMLARFPTDTPDSRSVRSIPSILAVNIPSTWI